MTRTAHSDPRFTTLGDSTPRLPGETPPWFTEAVTTPHDTGAIDVEGATISYRAWGRHGDPVVVLVHGGGAHAGWWDHIAPLLTEGRRVVAPDLAGHGDSSWRPSYTFEGWARETIAVAAAEGEDRPILVGHSMGGCVCLVAAHLLGPRARGLGVVDSLVSDLSPVERAWVTARSGLSEHRVYPTISEAVARFRALPADPATLEYIRAHIATESLGQMGDGWRWKFDPSVYYDVRLEPPQVPRVACSVAVVGGERGLSTPEVMDAIDAGTGAPALRIRVPDAGHHILLEQPVALISVLATLLSVWS